VRPHHEFEHPVDGIRRGSVGTSLLGVAAVLPYVGLDFSLDDRSTWLRLAWAVTSLGAARSSHTTMVFGGVCSSECR
jgi:hypothetical protein